MIRRISHQTRTASRREGFTLLEVLVVVAILVILASVATFSYFRYIEDAKVDTARQTMKTLEQAAKNYTVKSGGNPPQSLQELIQPSDGGRSFIEGGAQVLIDPWGQQYQYDPSHTTNGIDPDPMVFTKNPSNGQIIKALGRNN